MSTEPAMTPFKYLNFRTAGNFKLDSSAHPSKKGEKMFRFKTEKGYELKTMTPPGVCRWAHVHEGGNFGIGYASTRKAAHLTVTYIPGGDENEFVDARKDFFTTQRAQIQAGLKMMWDANVSGVQDAAIKKAQKYYKKKTPEEQLEKAYANFLKDATTPIKDDTEHGTQMTIRCPAYTLNDEPRQSRFVQVKNTPAGDAYVRLPAETRIHHGAVMCVPFLVRPYAVSATRYGVTYKMIPDFVVYSTGSSAMSVPDSVVENARRPIEFSFTEKNNKQYVNTKDKDGHRMLTRLTPTEVKFTDLQDGTLGKVSGHTESNAKLAGVLKEDPSDPESVAMFDYLEGVSNDALTFIQNEPGLLTRTKAELQESAKDLADETGETVESTFRTLLTDLFNNPVSKREDDDYRTVKIQARMFQYGTTTRNVIPLQDEEGNDITGAHINYGAKIAPVVSPSFYFLADGNFGMHWNIDLGRGIRVLSNPDREAAGGGVLYASKKRPASELGDAEESAAKRVHVEA